MKTAIPLLILLLITTAGVSSRDPLRVEDPPSATPASPVNSTNRVLGRYTADDWLQFNDAEKPRPRMAPFISTGNVDNLRQIWRVSLPEQSDASPVLTTLVLTDSGFHDLVIFATNKGRLVALDAWTGGMVWMTNPPPGPRWTTSSPAIDPSRAYVYVYCLDGKVHKHAINDGREIIGDGWPELITLKGDVEKGSSALTIVTAKNGASYLYATIAAYPDPGDFGDYQGHVVAIDLETGRQNIFNAACSDRPIHFVNEGNASNDCVNRQAGIWARAGVVYNEALDRIYLTTGNGVFDADAGGYNWASSVVALRPDGSTDGGTPLDSYTPTDFQRLNDEDLDLSSTTVAPLKMPVNTKLPPLAVQGGKDWRLRLLNLADLSGQGGPRHVGGELQLISIPQKGEILTRPATWLQTRANRAWVFVGNYQGLSAFTLDQDAGGAPVLTQRWVLNSMSTSPVIANGILYHASEHLLIARDPITGRELWSAPIGSIHWQSPIIANGTVFIADGEGFVNAFHTD